MTRLLAWLNRMPCRCVKKPYPASSPNRSQVIWPKGTYVARSCWRHALLEWLNCRSILIADAAADYYYHRGYIEWRPWRWWSESARVANALRIWSGQ